MAEEFYNAKSDFRPFVSVAKTSEFAQGGGYLSIDVGDIVQILHVGCARGADTSEIGWLFVQKLLSGEVGWIRRGVLLRHHISVAPESPVASAAHEVKSAGAHSISLRKGEQVLVSPQISNCTSVDGWIWCQSKLSGIEGWVPDVALEWPLRKRSTQCRLPSFVIHASRCNCSSYSLLVHHNTLIAVDGKIIPKTESWGVGIENLDDGFAVYSGGKMSDAVVLHDCWNRIDQATIETLALTMAIDFVRKFERTESHASVATSFVTDRTATLVTMQELQKDFPVAERINSTGFHAAVHLCSFALLKLCLLRGTVTIMHKNNMLSQKDIKPNEWRPDTLAGIGCRRANVPLSLPLRGSHGMRSCLHLLTWGPNFRDESLLMQCSVKVIETPAALAYLGFKTYADFIKAQTQGDPQRPRSQQATCHKARCRCVC